MNASMNPRLLGPDPHTGTPSFFGSGKAAIFLFWTMAAALALRLGYVFYVGSGLTFPDEERYLRSAMGLLGKEGVRPWTSAHDMPLPILATAVTSLLAGGSLYGMKIFQCLVSAAMVVPVAMAARRLEGSTLSAGLAALATAVYPFYVFYANLILSETLFCFFVSLLFALALAPGGTWRRPGLACGIVAGLAHLTRPTMLYFLPVLLVWLLWTKRFTTRNALVFLFAFSLMVAPWVARNMAVHGTPILNTSGAGIALWFTNNDWNTQVLNEVPPGVDFREVGPPELEELEKNDWYRQQAVAWIKEHPGEFLRRSVKRTLRFWNIRPNAASYGTGIYALVSIATFGPVLLLGLLGIPLLRRKRGEVLILSLFLCYYTVIHAITMGSIRYRLPVEGVLISLAGASAATLCKRYASALYARFRHE